MPHSEAEPLMTSEDGSHAPEQCISPNAYLGLHRREESFQAISKSPKCVSIAHQHETISPLILGSQKSVEDFHLACGHSSKKLAIKSRRLSGRPSCNASPSLKALASSLDLTAHSAEAADEYEPVDASRYLEQLIDQVSAWIKEKRAKRHSRKSRAVTGQGQGQGEQPTSSSTFDNTIGPNPRRGSDASDESIDLDKLERIVKQNLSIRRQSLSKGPISLKRKTSSIRKHLRKPSTASDLDQLDEIGVPSCDAYLDNSKTLAYTGGASDLSDDSGGEDLKRIPSYRDFDAWSKFKFEIVRLAHTLRLKGWRKVPLETSSAIEVHRLSGALTNAVYVVSPPCDLPLEQTDEAGNIVFRKPPPKLLLRIYGPQVGHLIDRESELAILRRLAKKRIGPRLLGTFANGRFEEFLHAKPLTPDDLRDPGTSRQIAKRMRELHAGVELLEQERSDGAFVWRNWDKWIKRVEQIVTWLDDQVLALTPNIKPTGSQAWMRRGLICGVPWETFRDVVQQYREWLVAEYGGIEKVQEQLIFTHNDTQYGNILRVVPTGESPLLLPANTHKQLIVIDFEYSNANTRGLEFANHFTEWCYNYHDERKPYAFNPTWYPTPQEQDRFVRAYLQHQPQFDVNTPKLGPATPSMTPTAHPVDFMKRSTSNLSDFMLDARTPQVTPLPAALQDVAAKAAEDKEVERLINETRMWRLANTAQWVAWGIVQAKVPGMPLFDAESPKSEHGAETDPEDLLGERAQEYRALAQEQTEDAEQEEEFDYLGYAQHRALFFWGDAVQMGFIKMEELPEETRTKLKTVPY